VGEMYEWNGAAVVSCQRSGKHSKPSQPAAVCLELITSPACCMDLFSAC